jgi:hypothetical protein
LAPGASPAAGVGARRGRGIVGPAARVGGLGEPGGDLLFRVLRRSTIGAEGFHGRVRDGIGCLAPRYEPPGCRSPRLSQPPALPGRAPTGGQKTADRRRRRIKHWWPVSVVCCLCRLRVLCDSAICERDGEVKCRAALRGGWGRVPVDARGGRPQGGLAAARRRCSGWLRQSSGFERLVPVGCAGCPASTSGLSTWWSSTALDETWF